MQDREHLLHNEKIPKLLLRLSAPATIAMFVNAFYNLIDTIFIGNSVGELGIGALSIALPIQLILTAFGLMIGVGAASAVSRSLGAKDYEKAHKVTGNAFLSIFLISIVLMIAGYVFMTPLLNLFGATDNIFLYAKEYLSILLLSTLYFPFTLTCNNLIRAEGNAKDAMIVLLIGALLNIVLDAFFIFGLNLGVQGAALATVVSKFIALFYIIYYYQKGKSVIKLKMHHFKLEFHILKEIVTVGFATFARNVAVSLIAIPINGTLRVLGGDSAIAIYGVIHRVLMFLYMPLFGVIQGMQPIVGYNFGAKQFNRLKEALKLSLLVATIIATLSSLIGIFFPIAVFSLFENDPNFIEAGAYALRIVIFCFPLVGIQIVAAALYQALGKALPSIILSILRQVVILVPLVLILPRLLSDSLLGVWLAFPISDFIAFVIAGFFMLKELKRIQHIEKQMTLEQIL
ncbi:putative MATE family efflux protein [Natranaerovirga hydrolytica]|uniref:Multidrug export protein MepA n=1 Tax=Natranaerovirga hydrolytica TaxID=680378 RepID=A0A4R1N1F3_9FIRM|nr:MATE family efflux transporter [Natranaerovirga hydrolytica]TCK97824.1 putative MATE family efflux protein [Natranaerovirga hydrolytica]